jgi:hypothetical protein
MTNASVSPDSPPFAPRQKTVLLRRGKTPKKKDERRTTIVLRRTGNRSHRQSGRAQVQVQGPGARVQHPDAVGQQNGEDSKSDALFIKNCGPLSINY